MGGQEVGVTSHLVFCGTFLPQLLQKGCRNTGHRPSPGKEDRTGPAGLRVHLWDTPRDPDIA